MQSLEERFGPCAHKKCPNRAHRAPLGCHWVLWRVLWVALDLVSGVLGSLWPSCSVVLAVFWWPVGPPGSLFSWPPGPPALLSPHNPSLSKFGDAAIETQRWSQA